uniref:UDP-glucuronosyltransferase n=1 Tax=Trialeurodes vaporariorum TaxID=88556 RepID=A0A873P505_TRIVP|nr:UDP-gluconosyltransferase [Trialeurodes vaporariorum]
MTLQLSVKMLLGSALIVLLLGSTVHSYNILFMNPTPSYSHQLPAIALTEALIKKGHHVFLVSTNGAPGLVKNYTYVDLSFSYKLVAAEETDQNNTLDVKGQLTKWDLLELIKGYSDTVLGNQFRSKQFEEFHNRVKDENIKFDVAILESFFLPHECAMTRLLNGFRVPIISFATFTHDLFVEPGLGTLPHRSFLPMESYTDRMNVWQRIENWFSATYFDYVLNREIESSARDYFREAHDNEALVDGCWSNVSLALIASNSLYFYPRLRGPNVIELGPMHLKPPAKLPQNLQDWLDGAEKGVIYFSLGSNMKSKHLLVPVRENFLKFFEELPAGYRVLWKWELDGKIPGQSDNVLAQKWMPQQSILAHPKVKVFITQGGLQSFQETVHFGVPTVVIPWYGDQETSAVKMMDVRIGTRIRPPELYSYEKVKSALETVLFDESYMKNMKRISAISRDFTSKSLDEAVFWVEHVTKFGGAPHLRPSTADATYLEYFCMDILTVILVIILAVLFLLRLVFRFLVSIIFSSPSVKIKKS